MCIMLVQHFLSSQCWLVLIYKKVNETQELVVYNLKPLEPLMIAKATYSSPQLLSSTAKSKKKKNVFQLKSKQKLTSVCLGADCANWEGRVYFSNPRNKFVRNINLNLISFLNVHKLYFSFNSSHFLYFTPSPRSLAFLSRRIQWHMNQKENFCNRSLVWTARERSVGA